MKKSIVYIQQTSTEDIYLRHWVLSNIWVWGEKDEQVTDLTELNIEQSEPVTKHDIKVLSNE